MAQEGGRAISAMHAHEGMQTLMHECTHTPPFGLLSHYYTTRQHYATARSVLTLLWLKNNC